MARTRSTSSVADLYGTITLQFSQQLGQRPVRFCEHTMLGPCYGLCLPKLSVPPSQGPAMLPPDLIQASLGWLRCLCCVA